MATPSPAPDGPGVLVTHGARAAEEVLLELLAPHLAPAGGDDALAALATPVRVVVPSRSLRLHLGARLVRRHGAVAGVQVQTLFTVAREVLERCGDAAAGSYLPGDPAFEVLVRRLARAEPALAGGLEFLVDGYGAVAATVRDLLDAGLEPVLAEAADEALAETRTPAADRARALVRVAAGVHAALGELGAVRLTTLYQRAAGRLADDPERALPSRTVLIHGFADATGLATDLLAALVRHRGARLLLDAPPDPGTSAGAADLPETAGGDAAEPLPPRFQEAFAERLRERLAGLAGQTAAAPASPPAPPRVDLFAAPGAEAEARELAVRVRALLDDADAAVEPEEVAIVARDLEPLRLALRRHLSTLGVPFSGLAARGSLSAAGRRARALLDLLRKGRDLPADRWLDAAASLPRAEPAGTRRRRGPFVDLRLAFYASGTGRLRDVAELAVDDLLAGREGLPLPVRRGFSYDAAGGEDDDGGTDGGGDGAATGAGARRGGSYARRRYVPRGLLAGAVDAAAALLDRLAGWPASAPPAVHLERLRALLRRDLGWHPGEADALPVFDALARLGRELPAGLEIGFDELRRLLHRALAEAGRGELGGRGGGVQVLSVTEARFRTFGHLFVAGVQRGAFPRTVRPDPLLPDELRAALAPVLPDLPRKRAGFDEERYHFAQLLSSSPRVTVSWQSHDEEGQPLAPSPLAERLAGPGGGERVARAPAVFAARGGAGAAPRPAREEAVLAALAGASRAAFGGLLAAAVEESRGRLGEAALALPAVELAAARRRVLDEVDPDLRDEEGRARAHRLGPYLGFLGPVREGIDDPRRGDPWITHAENLAACPWQTFLRKVLRLEPTPDPLQALPGSDPLLLGSVVHAVLERVAEEAGAAVRRPLGETLTGEPRPLVWPPDAVLGRWLLDAAGAALREDGVPLPGLARALAERARPLVERARELDENPALREPAFDGSSEPAGPCGVLGAEVEGTVAVTDGAGRPRRLRFLADRAEAVGGRVRLTDYKTGKPLSEAKTEETRARHHLAGVAQGQRLQAVGYALAAASLLGDAAGHGTRIEGRYLFLRPEIEDPEAASFAAGAADPAFAAAFRDAVATLLAAWDAGAFFPRVVDPSGQDEPLRCAWCEVAEACVRGDSGARLRLHRWNAEHAEAAEAGGAASDAERAHHGVWELAAAPGATSREEEGG
jgi:RecB family exonuclease